MEATQELHSVQRAFRAVMDAMARPGKIFKLGRANESTSSLPGLNPGQTLGIKMFVDQSVRFNVLGGASDELVRAIQESTRATPATLQQADFIIVPSTTEASMLDEAFAQASGGTLLSPEKGAVFLIGCEQLSVSSETSKKENNSALCWVSVEGPGIKKAHTFGTSQSDWIWPRNRRADEFPCGVEIILFDTRAQVVAIPRTSFVSPLAMKGESSWDM